MCAIACLAVVGGCGGGDNDERGSIPSGTGNAIINQLELVRTLNDEGDCDGAEATAQEVRDAIGNLPSEVDGELEEALVEASDNLVSQTREDCEKPDEPDPPAPPPTGTSDDAGVLEGEEG